MSNPKRNFGPQRLKAEILAIIDRRIDACRQAEARYEAMSAEDGGGMLGSVDLADRSVATERCARMEAELIRRYVAELPVAQR